MVFFLVYWILKELAIVSFPDFALSLCSQTRLFHRVAGAIARNPPEGVMLLDEKK
jgi:hypothetical protein